MGMYSVGRKFEGLNVAPSPQRVFGETNKKDELRHFTQVEWKNKNNGKTYIAKKINLSQNGKELTGIFVFDKEAKPDKTGNINGEFMSYDTFLKKISDEVPTINSTNAKGYFPNINYANNDVDLSAPLELGIEFDKTFDSSLKLSDGRMILKPTMEGASRNIEKDANGNYQLTSRATVMGSKPHVQQISEFDIINNRMFCAGTVKKLDEDKYEVTYYTSPAFRDNNTKTVVMGSMECALFMENNFLSTYPTNKQ